MEKNFKTAPCGKICDSWLKNNLDFLKFWEMQKHIENKYIYHF